ncbi:hypothetical protein [Tsukamurella sp. 8J]|uniref:hypothetical protein n=1 Tax=Tsukamurella sp. 8J TaxID=3031962 RepID=UPI0023B956E2|nr:hypothetical protein [Tsukamurella sp. 8J]MDF0531019.1 hypothetical protein [Tsukamurella sp. 8J]
MSRSEDTDPNSGAPIATCVGTPSLEPAMGSEYFDRIPAATCARNSSTKLGLPLPISITSRGTARSPKPVRVPDAAVARPSTAPASDVAVAPVS